MIRLSLGNVGSGKTLCEVRNILNYKGDRITYTNIKLKKKKDNVRLIEPWMIIKKELKSSKTKRDGTIEESYKYSPNIEFWASMKEPVNIVLDEFHNIASSREAMTSKNRSFNKFLTAIRKIFGSSNTDGGELVLISQNFWQVDVQIRIMAHQIRIHNCYWVKECLTCRRRWIENSNMPEERMICKRCNGIRFKKYNHTVIQKRFTNRDFRKYEISEDLNLAYATFRIKNLERYFDEYNSFQFENLFEEI